LSQTKGKNVHKACAMAQAIAEVTLSKQLADVANRVWKFCFWVADTCGKLAMSGKLAMNLGNTRSQQCTAHPCHG